MFQRIYLEMGFATTDLDNFKILEDIPSFPVAFFIPILHDITKQNNKTKHACIDISIKHKLMYNIVIQKSKLMHT